jgi:hypothetical protein
MCNLDLSSFLNKKYLIERQYLGQLRKAEGGLSGVNTAQASDLVENLGE